VKGNLAGIMKSPYLGALNNRKMTFLLGNLNLAFCLSENTSPRQHPLISIIFNVLCLALLKSGQGINLPSLLKDIGVRGKPFIVAVNLLMSLSVVRLRL